MAIPNDDRSVEERLSKARLLPRINQEVLAMCKSVDQLLHAQHISNLAQAVVCVQEIARENFAVVIALKWVVLLVDMLESDAADVRLAACNALAAVSVAQEGRDAVRTSGGLRPLVMLLAEGSRSPVAAAAASALMNCSACDVCKEAIADCRGVTMLMSLIRDAVMRCNTSGSGVSSSGAATGSGSGASLAAGGSSLNLSQELRTPGDCKAAVYAAGALMNMGGVISVQQKMMAAGATNVLEAVIRVATPGDVVATRANFMISWLAMASGEAGSSRQSDRDKRDHQHHHHHQHPQHSRGSFDSVSLRATGLGSVRSSSSGSGALPPAAAPTQLPRLDSTAKALTSLSIARRTSASSDHKPGTPPASAAAAGKAAVVAGHA